MPPPIFAANGTPGALSLYDTSPLRDTLNELIDFDLLNQRKGVRLSVRRAGDDRQFGLF